MRREADPTASVPGRITLLTDFGAVDGFVAAMRGVIAARDPVLVVDEVAHDVPRGDVSAAAAALARYWREYPRGTVHVVVVDPGVGGPRRALVVAAAGRFGVGPDNGVLTPMLESPDLEQAREVANAALFRPAVSSTFHGRDIFAPVAAFLARGGAIEAAGAVLPDALRLPRPEPERTATGARGVVTGSDRFGNLSTNLPAAMVAGAADVRLGGRPLGALRKTWADVGTGEAVALIGSDGLLEIAVRDGSAAEVLGAGRGAAVEVFRIPAGNV